MRRFAAKVGVNANPISDPVNEGWYMSYFLA